MCESSDNGGKVKRTCQLWDSGNGWVLTITQFFARRSCIDTHYHLTALRSDWGRAFRLEKVTDGQRPVYHVNLASDGPSCDCMGHLQHGHCKHCESLLALQARGKLDQVRPAAPAEAPAEAPRPATKPAAAAAAPAVVWEDL